MPDNRRHNRSQRPEKDEDFTRFSSKRFVGTFLLCQNDVGKRRQHADAKEHRQRLNPEQFVSERGAGGNAGGGGARAQRHGGLKQARSAPFNISHRFGNQRFALQLFQLLYILL